MFEKNPPRDIDLLIVDEAQHDAASSMARLHNIIQPKMILGLTATPFRTDRVKLCFDRVVKDAGIHQLIQDNYLSRFDHYTIPSWNVDSLAQTFLQSPQKWGRSIFFLQRLKECFELHQKLQSGGIPCDVVTGSSDRDQQLKDFRAGRLQVLINCMVLTEGFNDPSLQTVWVRPSGRGPTIQMAGRVLRKYESLSVKNIVQPQQTRHPFVRTAKSNSRKK